MILFRELKHEDYKDIVDISKGVWEDTDYLPGVFHSWIDEDCIVLGGIDEANGKVVSIMRFSILSDKSGWIDGLRVHKAYRGQGIGKITVYKVFQIGKSALQDGRISRLGFATVSNSLESIGIFKKLNFKVVDSQILTIKSNLALDEHIKLEDYKLEPWVISYEDLLREPYLIKRKGILPLAFIFEEFTKELYNSLLRYNSLIKINGHRGIFKYKGGPNFLAFEDDFQSIDTFTNYYLLRYRSEVKEIYTPILSENLELIKKLKEANFIATDNWKPDYLYFLYKENDK